MATELGVSPGEELAQLHRSLLDDDITAPYSPRAGSVPTPLSGLIGRQADVDAVCDLLRHHRLVTLTGIGGVGKSRLAIAVTDRISAGYPAGAWFVALAGASEPGDVDSVVAASLGPLVADMRPVRARVADAIGARRLLLLLDNCEHVADAVAALATHLLGHCPRLTVLATSRSPLLIAGERRVDVRPLELATAAPELLRVRASEAGAVIPADAESDLDALSERLAGIPLVIELAARHVAPLGLRGLLERLSDHLDVAMIGQHGVSAHHRTVRACLDWSWDVLDDGARRTLARLGVFTGSFDMCAVEGVVGGPETDVVESFTTLVNASMVVTDHPGGLRYRLLEPVRQYAVERLDAIGDADPVSARHTAYMTSLAESLGRRLAGPDEIEAASEVAAVREDLRVAWRWAVTHEDADTALRLVTALADYAEDHVWSEPWTWCERTLDLPGAADHPRRAAALDLAAAGAWQSGRYQECVVLAGEALARSVPGDDAWLDAQRLRADALLWLDRLEESVVSLQQAVDADPDPRSPRGMRRRGTLAMVLNHIGRPDRIAADRLFADAVASQHPTSLAAAHHVKGVMLAPDQPERALAHQTVAADLASRSGAVLVHGFALAALAALLTEPTRRAQAITEVMAHYLRHGNRTHLRSFGRGIIVPLADCRDWEAVVVVDAATREQPAFAGSGDRIDRAVEAAARHLQEIADVHASHGASMTDDELVDWLRARLA